MEISTNIFYCRSYFSWNCEVAFRTVLFRFSNCGNIWWSFSLYNEIFYFDDSQIRFLSQNSKSYFALSDLLNRSFCFIAFEQYLCAADRLANVEEYLRLVIHEVDTTLLFRCITLNLCHIICFRATANKVRVKYEHLQ